jgi:UDP-2,4-diacetamido-2,4,6-trideoxy-beta-L-altropyranose hydrolase
MPVKSNIQHLLIRADAGGLLGTGHVMRMIALAQAWQDRGGEVTIASCQCPRSLIERIHLENIVFRELATQELGDTSDSLQTTQIGKELGVEWIVIDGYHFQEDYQRVLKNQGFKVLAVDDYGHCDSWHADLLLNQNIQDWNSEEATHPATREGALRGPQFALLRREFRSGAERVARIPSNPLRILVTFGGVDPVGAALRVLESLNRLPSPQIELKVLAGPANPRLDTLQSEAAKSPHPIEIIPSSRDMPSLYRWADRVISAGGSSCYEWMFFGIPGWVTSIAENQDRIVKSMLGQNLAAGLPTITDCDFRETSVSIGAWLNLDDPPRSSLVDGYGALRVAAAMSEPQCWVRPVMPENDAQFLFNLANHETVRAVGRYPQEIQWDEHLAWLQRHCKSSQSRLMIIETVDRGPAGQIRFHEKEPGVWETGVSIHPDFRKARLAHMSLSIAMRLLEKECRVGRWLAEIKTDNLASQRLFAKLGFIHSGWQGDLQTWFLETSGS